MDRIPINEVAFDPHSYRDPDGRVFRWRGHIYRGISAGRAPLFERLCRDGTIPRLVDYGLLVDTELTDYVLNGYELVVRHRSIPFVSYPTEWCATMLRDAALVTLDLVKELAACGLTLKDAHPWNLLFNGPKPLHIDLTSIMPLGKDCTWVGYNEFCRNFFRPLLLMSNGRDQLARWFLDTDQGVWRRDLLKIVPATAPSVLIELGRSQFNWLLRRYHASDWPSKKKCLLALLRHLRLKVEEMVLPVENTYATNNKKSSKLPAGARISATERKAIHEVTAGLQPESILTIGSDAEFYSTLATLGKCNIVAFDTQPQCVAQLYHFAQARHLPILPLLIDFTKAVPACRPRGHQTPAAWTWDSLAERFRSDMVLAPWVLELLHAEQQDLSWDQITEALTLFSRKWLVVRFIKRQINEMNAGQQKYSDWGMPVKLIESLKRSFREVNEIAFEPVGSAILVCEK